MKLYFMKKEALDILKSNLDMVYNMYFTEKDNKWLWKVCGGDPFVEFKEIQDFQLAPIDSDTSKGEVEFANCKIIYQHLSFLTESQACDERPWAGLCHSVYYDYLRKRWDYDTKSPKTQHMDAGVQRRKQEPVMKRMWWRNQISLFMREFMKQLFPRKTGILHRKNVQKIITSVKKFMIRHMHIFCRGY